MNKASFWRYAAGGTLVVLGGLAGVSVTATAQASGAAAQSQSRQTPHSGSGASIPRTNLKPRLKVGDVMRYRIELQTTSQTTHTGAVADPQGPSELVVTWDATVRLDVIDPADISPAGQAAAPRAAQGRSGTKAANAAPLRAGSKRAATGSLRMRTTYEQSVATLHSDTPDPEAESIEKQYADLAGKSIEFTLDSDGHISDVRGMEGIVSGEQARSAAEQWMAQLEGSSSAPAAGIIPGQSWSSQEPASAIPLADLVWQTDSSYLRNESCQAANSGANVTSLGGESCAVILSRLALVAAHSPRDSTPEEYRRKGLHTTGRWTGSGESLSYISLKNGWVVSVTQTGTEQMDVSITNATGLSVRYAGTVHTRSDLSLVPDAESGQTVSPATPPAGGRTPASPKQ